MDASSPDRHICLRDGHHRFVGRVIVADLSKTQVRGRDEFFEGQSWLADVVMHQRTVGFDMEWKPDRGTDNPVALLQFADEDTALLLRTHVSKRWLPKIVLETLKSPYVKKVCIGYDSNDKRKLINSFDFELVGHIDIVDLVCKKGIQCSPGLQKLTEHFGWRVKKDKIIGRSDWSTQDLSEEQVAYAAEDAFFTLKLLGVIQDLPDALVPEDGEADTTSAFRMEPDWVEQGVVRKDDGMWCTPCGAGPMLNGDIVKQHLTSKKHQAKLRPPPVPTLKDLKVPTVVIEEIPPEMEARGIARGTWDHPRVLPSEFLCVLCDAGPFKTIENTDSHLRSRGHQKQERLRELGVPVLPSELEEEGMQTVKAGVFRCSICSVENMTTLDAVLQHVKGAKHAKQKAKLQSETVMELSPGQTTEATVSTSPGTTASPGASSAASEPAEDVRLLLLPGYVDYFEGVLTCCICNARPQDFEMAVQHLTSKKTLVALSQEEPS